MDAPLWTEAHAPDLDDLPQAEFRDRLARAVDQPMNLVVQGPPGVGKTAGVRAMGRAAHDDTEADLLELNVADFFDRSKKEIREDPRFEHFLQGQTEFSKQYRRGGDQRNKYKREWSKRAMIGHVLKEYAGHAPASGQYKTLVLDNSEAIREDFQQALRRVIERNHRTTQFVIVTRQPSKLIPPIRSRCFPVPVRAPTVDELVGVLEPIVEREGVPHDGAGLEYVAGYADGNVRRAVLGAQTTAVEDGEITMDAACDALGTVGHDEELRAVLADAWDGAIADARDGVDDLLDEGYDGPTLLRDLLRVARSATTTYDDRAVARLHRLAGPVDHDLETGTNDRLHVTRLLAQWGQGDGAATGFAGARGTAD
ncbi:MAG: AAA family ATPase [Haloferacaceae archaeon]